jgi:DNA replication protein DnaC
LTAVATTTLIRLRRTPCLPHLLGQRVEPEVGVGTAIQAGYTALYRSAFDLVQNLAEAQATGTRRELIGRLCKVDLLAIEDLGMRRLPPTAAEDLLEVFTRRYEQGAIILTTNRPLEDWGQVLGDTAVAGAILDRFLHHTEIIRLQGRSYRMYDRQQRGGSQPLQALTKETR